MKDIERVLSFILYFQNFSLQKTQGLSPVRGVTETTNIH